MTVFQEHIIITRPHPEAKGSRVVNGLARQFMC